jgi:hypothetical protein
MNAASRENEQQNIEQGTAELRSTSHGKRIFTSTFVFLVGYSSVRCFFAVGFPKGKRPAKKKVAHKNFLEVGIRLWNRQGPVKLTDRHIAERAREGCLR